MTGLQQIAAERKRQITEERYTPTHDRLHSNGVLACAAAVYATPPEYRAPKPRLWPGGWSFKPSPDDRVRELVKAGALIAAEIDRLGTGDRG